MLFEYTRFPGMVAGLPVIDLTLLHKGRPLTMAALVDSGAAMSILPHETGLQLGFVWKEQTIPVKLGGIFRDVKARGVGVYGVLPEHPEVRLAFAWLDKVEFDVRPILGQFNFFREFKITFEGYKDAFDISPKQ